MSRSLLLSRRLPLVLTLAGTALISTLSAADHDNLEAGLPTTVVDAYPVHFQALESQIVLGYQKPDREDGGFVISPRLEVGAAPNLQVGASVTFITDGDREHSGDITLDALYGFTQESLWFPGLALAADVALPTGKGSHGLRTTAMAVLTKGLVPSWPDRWHVNVGWEFLSDPRDEERDRRFVAVLGHSCPINTDTVMVVDGVRRQGETIGSPWLTSVEVGFRRQISPLAVASLGGGLDFADHTGYAGVRVVLGMQHSF